MTVVLPAISPHISLNLPIKMSPPIEAKATHRCTVVALRGRKGGARRRRRRTTGWVAPSLWFWIKMVLVLAMLVSVTYAGINFSRAEKGDRAAAQRQPVIGMTALVLFVAIMLSAVLAFHVA